jgi:hypothetical protein
VYRPEPLAYVDYTLLIEIFRQDRIDHGELIRWTKGFGALNTEGRDVAEMFRQSLLKYVFTNSLAAG